MKARVPHDADMAAVRRTRSRRTRALGAVLVLVGCCAAAGPTWSGQGGKAEPLRLRFERGRSSATVSGVLRGDAQREYVLQARRGQSLTIQMTATPPRSLRLTARGPAGTELPLVAGTRFRWSLRLPEDGDYELWVARTRAAPGSSRYRLTVAVH